jgi:hypothetical protein
MAATTNSIKIASLTMEAVQLFVFPEVNPSLEDITLVTDQVIETADSSIKPGTKSHPHTNTSIKLPHPQRLYKKPP